MQVKPIFVPRPRLQGLGQKLVIELTESGNELSNLIVAINHFGDSYLRLQGSINKYFNLGNSNGKPITVSQFRHGLKERGWEKKDFSNYPKWLEEVYQIQYLSSLAIIEALIARYFSIMFRFNLRGLAKEILTTLILDTLRDYLFSRLVGLLSNAVSFEQKQYIYNKILDQLTGRTIAYFLNYAPPVQKNRFIQSESIEIVKSLCRVLSPSPEFLKLAFGEQATRDSVVKQQLDYLESLTTSK